MCLFLEGEGGGGAFYHYYACGEGHYKVHEVTIRKNKGAKRSILRFTLPSPSTCKIVWSVEHIPHSIKLIYRDNLRK